MHYTRYGLILGVLWLVSGHFGFAEGPEKPPQLLEHPKRFYTAPDGKQYAPQSIPIFIHLSHSAEPTHSMLLQQEDAHKLPKPKPILLPEGPHLIKDRTADGLDYTIYSDGTPPKTAPIYKKAPQYTTKKDQRLIFGRNLEFTFESQDALSGVQEILFALNGEGYLPLRQLKMNNTMNGHYEFYFYAVDNVGNVEPFRPLIFDIDVSVPTTVLTYDGIYDGNILSSQGTIVLTSTDNNAGIANIFYSIDKQKEQKYTGNIAVDQLPDGPHKITYYAEDNVANIEKTHSVDFYHDNTVPQVLLSVKGSKHESKGVLYVSKSSVLQIDASDNKAGVEKIEYTIGLDDPISYTIPFSPPEEQGMHRIIYYAEDRVKNRNEKLIRLYMDASLPESEFKIIGTSFWNGPQAVINKETKIELKSADMESGVRVIQYCINDEKCQPYTNPLTFEKDGTYKLFYYSIDNTDNQEIKKELSILVDNSPRRPSTSSAGPLKFAKRWYFHETQGLIGAEGLEFFIRIANTPEVSPDSLLLALPLEDKDSEQLQFKQSGSNQMKLQLAAAKKTFKVKIDGEAPSTSIQYSGAEKYVANNITFYGPGLKITLASQEPSSGIQAGVLDILYSLDGSQFLSYKEPIAKLLFNEKVYNLRYYSLDQVGNIEKIHEVEFTTDMTKPRTSHTVRPPFFGSVLSSKSTIELSAEDNLSGIRNIYYKFNEQPEKVYREPFTGKVFDDLGQGKHTIYFYSIDNVGNRGLDRKFPFFLDQTTPTLNMTILGQQHKTSQHLYVANSTRYRLRAEEETTQLRALQYQIDGGAWIQYETPIQLPEEEGTHTIAYRSVDMVENYNTLEQKVYLDTKVPKTRHELEGMTYRYKDILYINAQTKLILSFSDNASGIRETLYKLGGNPLTRYQKPIQISVSGDYSFEYYSVDHVDNKEEPSKTGFFVDADAPEITVTLSKPVEKQMSDGTGAISPETFIYINTTDAHTGVKEVFYKINDEEQKLYRRPIRNIRRKGPLDLEIIATDWVNNIKQIKRRYHVER